MWNRKELKAKGKAAFKANYWKCVLVAFILTAIIGGFAASTRSRVDDASGAAVTADGTMDMEIDPFTEIDALNDTFAGQDGIPPLTEEDIGLPDELKPFLNSEDTPAVGEAVPAEENFSSMPEGVKRTIALAILGALGAVAAVGCVLKLLVLNTFTVGCKRFFYVNSDAPAGLGELLHGFKNSYGRVVVGMLLRDLFTFLWSLLFFIPGIIKTYSYRMTPYILADNPDISGKDAITLSRQMMKGQKWKAFVLDLSFLGWYLLAAVTLGIVNVFWTEPYAEATNAELYKTLKNGIG